jgi:cytochrome o ubiquinol oxidase subunit 2
MPFPRLRYGLALFPLTLLGGCGMVVMAPSGDIASQQADLIITSTLLMLIVIVPDILLTTQPSSSW